MVHPCGRLASRVGAPALGVERLARTPRLHARGDDVDDGGDIVHGLKLSARAHQRLGTVRVQHDASAIGEFRFQSPFRQGMVTIAAERPIDVMLEYLAGRGRNLIHLAPSPSARVRTSVPLPN